MLKPEGKKEILKIKQDNDSGGGEYSESFAGCTANVCLIANGTIYVANAGDSRTLLCCKGKPVEMSKDHKPDDDVEYNRITQAGGYSFSNLLNFKGFITEGRINGNLNLSRCIGDFEYKKDEKLT